LSLGDGQLKHEIAGKSFDVPLHLLAKAQRPNTVELREMTVEHDPATS
jgi:hypothetical protein